MVHSGERVRFRGKVRVRITHSRVLPVLVGAQSMWVNQWHEWTLGGHEKAWPKEKERGLWLNTPRKRTAAALWEPHLEWYIGSYSVVKRQDVCDFATLPSWKMFCFLWDFIKCCIKFLTRTVFKSVVFHEHLLWPRPCVKCVICIFSFYP